MTKAELEAEIKRLEKDKKDYEQLLNRKEASEARNMETITNQITKFNIAMDLFEISINTWDHQDEIIENLYSAMKHLCRLQP